MTQVQFEEANIIAPVLNTDNHKAQLALDVDTAGDSYDLSTLLTNWSRGHFIELTAEGGDVYYAFGPNDAGAIDETARDAGNTVCQVLFEGTSKSMRIPDDYTHLYVKSGTTCVLRIAVTSLAPTQGARDL